MFVWLSPVPGHNAIFSTLLASLVAASNASTAKSASSVEKHTHSRGKHRVECLLVMIRCETARRQYNTVSETIITVEEPLAHSRRTNTGSE